MAEYARRPRWQEMLVEDEFVETLALLADLELLVDTGRVAVEAEDEDTPVRFRPTTGPLDRAARELGYGVYRDGIFDPRD
jgi:hypothetical protein